MRRLALLSKRLWPSFWLDARTCADKEQVLKGKRFKRISVFVEMKINDIFRELCQSSLLVEVQIAECWFHAATHLHNHRKTKIAGGGLEAFLSSSVGGDVVLHRCSVKIVNLFFMQIYLPNLRSSLRTNHLRQMNYD